MIEMTYDDYDAMVEKFEAIKEGGKVITVWPTEEQIETFQKDPEKWIEYACYLHECNPPPETPEEKHSRKILSDFINRNLCLVDDEPNS